MATKDEMVKADKSVSKELYGLTLADGVSAIDKILTDGDHL